MRFEWYQNYDWKHLKIVVYIIYIPLYTCKQIQKYVNKNIEIVLIIKIGSYFTVEFDHDSIRAVNGAGNDVWFYSFFIKIGCGGNKNQKKCFICGRH